MHDADIIIEAATQRLTDFLTAKKMRKTPERYVILRRACYPESSQETSWTSRYACEERCK